MLRRDARGFRPVAGRPRRRVGAGTYGTIVVVLSTGSGNTGAAYKRSS